MPENHAIIRKMVCSVCGSREVEVHHWRTRGSGGTDELDNLVPLCRVHHDECHTSGRGTFWEKYKSKIVTYRLIYGLPALDVESGTLWGISCSTSGA